jgi:iron transport multicopper oxidase
MATFVEAPLEIQRAIPAIPADHLAVCEKSGMPTRGNAAGNTVDLLDLSGENVPPRPLPSGYVPSFSPSLSRFW